MFETIASKVGVLFVVAVCGFAFWKGDETERAGAGAYILSWFASLLVQVENGLFTKQYGIFGVDCIMLVVYGALIWKSRATWLIWAIALQLLAVMSHIMIMVDINTPVSSYLTVLNLTAYGILICLGVGTFWAWQERRAAGLE